MKAEDACKIENAGRKGHIASGARFRINDKGVAFFDAPGVNAIVMRPGRFDGWEWDDSPIPKPHVEEWEIVGGDGPLHLIHTHHFRTYAEASSVYLKDAKGDPRFRYWVYKTPEGDRLASINLPAWWRTDRPADMTANYVDTHPGKYVKLWPVAVSMDVAGE